MSNSRTSPAVSYVWLNKQGVRSSEGLEVQYTGRFDLEVRWGKRRKAFEIDGAARPEDFDPADFETWDNSAVANDREERKRICAAVQAALAFMAKESFK